MARFERIDGAGREARRGASDGSDSVVNLERQAMKSAIKLSRGRFLACMMAVALGFGTVPAAADPPDRTDVFPAGIACDFELHVEVRGFFQVFKDFLDKDGNVVRVLLAGKGSDLTFINADTGASLALKANGAAQHITLNPDGSSTWAVTGHNVLILFPTDVPAGPSTTLHVGRVVFDATANFDFDVLEVSGRTTDICAALSG